jgi:hypothetical protein
MPSARSARPVPQRSLDGLGVAKLTICYGQQPGLPECRGSCPAAHGLGKRRVCTIALCIDAKPWCPNMKVPSMTPLQLFRPLHASSDPLQQLVIMRGSRCLAGRPRRQQELAQLIALLVAQRLDVDLVLGLDLDWTALRTAVLELHRVAEGLQPRRQPRPGLLPGQSRQGLSIFGAMAYAAVTSWRLSRPSCGCVHRARLEQLGPVSPAALPKPIIGAGVH